MKVWRVDWCNENIKKQYIGVKISDFECEIRGDMGWRGGPDGRRNGGGAGAVRWGRLTTPAQHSTAEIPAGDSRRAASYVGGGD